MKSERGVALSTYYFYRMTDDTGNAPCVFEKNYKPTPNLLTLACCKGGQIRHNKNGNIVPVKTGLRYSVGERFYKHKSEKSEDLFVIGIMVNRVVYVAKITNVILMTEYFEKDSNYRNRMDCIYDVSDNVMCFENGYKWALSRRKCFNRLFHTETEQHYRDELGKYVLLSNNFVYFGGEQKSVTIDEVKDFMPKKQETKTYTESQHQIKEFVDSCFKTKVIAIQPTTVLNQSNCSSKGCQK